MDDVIGSTPDPPRRRRPVRMPALPGTRTPLGRRVLATVAVLAGIASVVTVGRAGLDPGPTRGAAPPTTRPVLGSLLQLTAGEDALYALVRDCRAPDPCRVALLASGSDGRTWRELPLPGGPRAADRARGWVLQVSGAGDQLSVEDPAAAVIHLGTTSFTTRPIVDGPPRTRVPAGRESLVRLCAAAPRCGSPTVEYLDPLTGVRSRLASQPPFPPAVVAVEGPQLWAAGIDPATRRYAVAVSTDDGTVWRTVRVPGGPAGAGAPAPRLVPVPEQDLAYLVLAAPGAAGVATVSGLWSVPDPQTGVAPRRVRPEEGGLAFGTAVGLRDGRLALAGAVPAVVASDGVVERAAAADPGEGPPLPYLQLQRGPRSLVVAEALPAPPGSPDDPTQVRLVVSTTGAPGDWTLRPVTLPR